MFMDDWPGLKSAFSDQMTKHDKQQTFNAVSGKGYERFTMNYTYMVKTLGTSVDMLDKTC
jgi:hypothetical protein